MPNEYLKALERIQKKLKESKFLLEELSSQNENESANSELEYMGPYYKGKAEAYNNAASLLDLLLFIADRALKNQ